MKYLRYFSEFYDSDNTLYRIELLQESDTAYTPQEVVLAADPVVIEWPEVTKINPLAGSGATLRLVSMSDRQFIDLYTVEPCTIRMDIYRAETLYWSGTLDTELFTEPYSFKDRYITEITFSDFGVLDRLRWEQKGVATISSVISTCLGATNILYTSIKKYISTSIPDVEGDVLDNCALRLDNFYDEDGEPWTMQEVLQEVLRPFTLQMRQKNGQIVIADLNALAVEATHEVEWRNADSQLGVEPVYNRVVATYSPYSKTTLFDAEFKTDDILKDGTEGAYNVKIPLPDTDYNSFNLHIGPSITEPTEVQGLTIGSNARLFRIEPDNSGSESAGVLWGWRSQTDSWIGNAPIDNSVLFADTTMLMQTPQIPIQNGAGYYNIKISLDVLFDPRTNPFESGAYNNDEEWGDFKHRVNFFAIPCGIFLYTTDGKVYTYNNSDLWNNIVGDSMNFNQAYFANQGKWVEGYGGLALLTYYSESDRKSDTGVGGWKSNKQSIGRWAGDIPKNITLNIDGEKIPMTNKVGMIQVIVYRGARFFDNDQNNVNRFSWVEGVLRWQLYKDLRVEVVKRSGAKVDVEDVEISAWLNKAAQEEISIDTYIGTPYSRIPMSRGVILRNDTSEAIEFFSRAGFSDKLEKLLVGTVYSNYAARRNTLEGTIKLIPKYTVLSDKSTVNSRYVVLSATENLAQATVRVKMAEFMADSYEGIEYE